MQAAHNNGSARKAQIGTAFGAAAHHYEASAGVQRIVAGHLATMAARERLSPSAQILEIGCGTGLLTRLIRQNWPSASLVATDLAPEMLDVAARGDSMTQFMEMDGEAPVFEGPWFDLIMSSLTFQWFLDLPGALARLHDVLKPGASLYFATMGADSFASWRAAHEACGERAGIAGYPGLADLQRLLAPYPDAFACDEHHALPERGGAALARHFHGLGAEVPRDDYRPLSPGAMRRVIRAFDERGGETSYHVLYGRITRTD